MESRGIRDQIVLATKVRRTPFPYALLAWTDSLRTIQYSGSWAATLPATKQQATYIGNCAKSMKLSVDASLQKLRTSYIDILYVHWWDFETSVKEVMDGLHKLVMQGKVLYLVSKF